METYSLTILAWIGIFVCISQSAMFSGLNLALLSISRLQLEVESSIGNPAAKKILHLRKDFNFLLTTILWGNVSVNVLLTLLSDSVMMGLSAFFFSTVVITFLGEIAPQAYFSRNAMRMGSMLSPLLRFYQILLYPVAKPSAKALDLWLGKEGISYFKERDLRMMIHKHVEAEESDLDHLEGMGILNFLALDDVPVTQEGEMIDEKSIIALPTKDGMPLFPDFKRDPLDPFLQEINRSRKKWVIIVDEYQQPYMALNADAFLREALLGKKNIDCHAFCHRPIIVKEPKTLLGSVMTKFKVYPESENDDVVDNDLILIWSDKKLVITGADILGRLLRGIVLRDDKGAYSA
ncbi:MAG: DUF21 domain-containing protein [Nitrospinae bacterium]|nr:DUF21 domain-containing protein [Nitrospinota bacterium]